MHIEYTKHKSSLAYEVWDHMQPYRACLFQPGPKPRRLGWFAGSLPLPSLVFLSENPVIPHILDLPEGFSMSLIFSLMFSVSFIKLYVLKVSPDFFFQCFSRFPSLCPHIFYCHVLLLSLIGSATFLLYGCNGFCISQRVKLLPLSSPSLSFPLFTKLSLFPAGSIFFSFS